MVMCRGEEEEWWRCGGWWARPHCNANYESCHQRYSRMLNV